MEATQTETTNATAEKRSLVGKLLTELNELNEKQAEAVAAAAIKDDGVDEEARAARVKAVECEWQARREAKIQELFEAGHPAIIGQLLTELNELNEKQVEAVAAAAIEDGSVDVEARAVRVKAAADEWRARRDAKCVQLFEAGLPLVGYVRVRINGSPRLLVFPSYDAAVQAAERINAMETPAKRILAPTALQGDILHSDGSSVRAGECTQHSVPDVVATLDPDCEAKLNAEIKARLDEIEYVIGDNDHPKGLVVRLKIAVETEEPEEDGDEDASGKRLVHTVTHTLSFGATSPRVRDEMLPRIAEHTHHFDGVSVEVEPFMFADFSKVAFVVVGTDDWVGFERAVSAFVSKVKPRRHQPSGGAAAPVNKDRDRS